MPDGDIIGLRDRLVADVATLVSKRRDMKLQLLCDGAPEMWNLLRRGSPKTDLVVRFIVWLTSTI